jgi:hypothetical protein
MRLLALFCDKRAEFMLDANRQADCILRRDYWTLREERRAEKVIGWLVVKGVCL